MAECERWPIDQKVLLHDMKNAFSVCAGFQSEIKSALDDLAAELSNPSQDSRAAIDQIIANDIDPCVEFVQITFDRVQVQLDILCEQCRSVK